MKKKFLVTCLISILSFNYFISPAITFASQARSVTTDNGTYTGQLGWKDRIEYSYPQSWIGTFPSTYAYKSGGYTGTLSAKKIILTPLEKVFHKDPVYRTDTKSFTKTRTGTYSTNSASNFSSTYTINEDGYSGTIPRKSVSWTTNYNTGRTKSLTGQWTDSTYRVRVSDVPEPSTYKGTYYDSGSGQNIGYSLSKSGGLYSVGTATTALYSTSYGRAENYDRNGHTKLGYMSPSKTQYWSYTLNFSDAKPRPPSDYYGPDGDTFGWTGWTLVDYDWDECCVRDAKASAWAYKTKNDGYMWVTDGGLAQRYRKGVYLKYKKNVQGTKYRQNYAGTIDLPNTVKNYSGTATYQGSLSKQVIDHYNEYYTASKWKIQVVYEGEVFSSNLTTKSISITDSNGNAVSYLVKDKQYKASIVIANNGELNVGAYKVGVYEQGVRKTQLSVSSHATGTDKTLSYTFTASTTGKRTFMAKADDNNAIQETNETDSDNTKSVDKNVYFINLKAKSISITDLSGNIVNHLTKGKQYIAKTVIANESDINLGAYKVGFSDSGTLLTRLDVSSHIKGEEKALTYKFIPATSGTRNFSFYADDLNVIEESIETDNSISKAILVNTLPVITVTYTPSDVYEGDTVNVCTRPSDVDGNPMTVKIFIKKDGGTEQMVLNQNNQANGSQQCYPFVSQVGRYDIRATVFDGYDESEVTTWFYSKPLIINGYVKHTPLWLVKHQDLGNASNQFYSGEKFVLEADVSPYPTVYVKSTLSAVQANVISHNPIVSLSKVSGIFFKGDLFDPAYLEYPTNLKVGPASFEFEVKYTNGVIKKATVPIEIISDTYKAYQLHRRF